MPIWGDRKAEDILKRDVVLLLESIVERGSPTMSNQTLKIVRKMFNFAVVRCRRQSSHREQLGIEQFTPHDLRRTAATFLAKMGNMDEVIDAVLNHVKQGVIKVYNQYRYDLEKQKALEAWERKLNSIISGTASKVIQMKRKNLKSIA